MHTFYILDFSCLMVPLRAACCHLSHRHLFSGKGHTGADWAALSACFDSSLLSLRQSHLSQGQAVDRQLRLLTLSLCHAESGKGFPSEGRYPEQLLSRHSMAFDWQSKTKGNSTCDQMKTLLTPHLQATALLWNSPLNAVSSMGIPLLF